MKKRIMACLTVLVVSVFAFGVYAAANDNQAGQGRRAEIKQEMDQERADAKAFHTSLKNMSSKDRKAAIKSFRATQAAKRKAFRDKMDAEMKSDIQNNAKQTPASRQAPALRPTQTPKVNPTPRHAPKI